MRRKQVKARNAGVIISIHSVDRATIGAAKAGPICMGNSMDGAKGMSVCLCPCVRCPLGSSR